MGPELPAAEDMLVSPYYQPSDVLGAGVGRAVEWEGVGGRGGRVWPLYVSLDVLRGVRTKSEEAGTVRYREKLQAFPTVK